MLLEVTLNPTFKGKLEMRAVSVHLKLPYVFCFMKVVVHGKILCMDVQESDLKGKIGLISQVGMCIAPVRCCFSRIIYQLCDISFL